MTDIFVLAGNNAGEVSLVCHLPVADANNAVGVNVRTALVASGTGPKEGGRRPILLASTTGDAATANEGEISDDESALLDTGVLFEVVASMRVPDGASNATLIEQAQAKYAAINASVQQTVGSRLNFFGHTMSAT